MEVLCLSSGSEKGYGRVMMRLLKKAKHLPMVPTTHHLIRHTALSTFAVIHVK